MPVRRIWCHSHHNLLHRHHNVLQWHHNLLHSNDHSCTGTTLGTNTTIYDTFALDLGFLVLHKDAKSSIYDACVCAADLVTKSRLTTPVQKI